MNETAERAGFEPARSVSPYAISSRARSTTPAPLQHICGDQIQENPKHILMTHGTIISIRFCH